jgi:uncharacterized membrane protein
MVLDMENAPSQDEIREAIGDAIESIDRWRFRTFCAAAAWVLCCAAIYPFMAGHSLHVYWDSIKFLVFLPTLIAPVALIFCAISWWGASSDVRSMKKLSREDL